MPSRGLPGSPERKLESRKAQEVLRGLARSLKPHGFKLTKPSFFTRSGSYAIEFVHIHKYSFGPCFRIHFGIRIRSDGLPAIALNGPAIDEIAASPTRGNAPTRFDFTVSEEASLADCVEAMYQGIISDGFEWFASLSRVSDLLAAKSPLSEREKLILQQELRTPDRIHGSEATQHGLGAI